MFPPPKPPMAQAKWGDLEVVVSLHDEEESVKPSSNYSKKKKVKKLKKKKITTQPEYLQPPANPEFSNLPGTKEPYDTNSSHGPGSDDGRERFNQMKPSSQKPPMKRNAGIEKESSFKNAGKQISGATGYDEGYSKFLRPASKGSRESFNQSDDDAFEQF